MAFSFSQQDTVRNYKMGEVRSALQKALRRGQEDAALYWATEIARSGFEAYLWNVLITVTAEDVGLAEPNLPATIWSLYSLWDFQRKRKNPIRPERLMWTQATFLLARAKKSRIIDDAMNAHWGTDERLYEVPDEALDPHTARGRQMGRSFPAFWDTSFHLENEDEDLVELGKEYKQRAIDAPCGEFSSKKPAVWGGKMSR